MLYPVIDLHCDMLSYLSKISKADPNNSEEIGCSIPYMNDGNVKIQTLAIYSGGDSTGYNRLTSNQIEWYKKLISKYPANLIELREFGNLENALDSLKTALIPSIENASVLADEDQPVEEAFTALDKIIDQVGKPLYISLTHHGENRFGGGNYTEAGLKNDGKKLLEYIAEKNITIDFSHTSDALSYGILEHITKKGLEMRIIASHSNYRKIFDHKRNLPDDLAKEIINRDGLIGVNFLRAFMHNEDPSYMMKHIEHGLKLGGEKTIAFGADYFYTADHPDYHNRVPFYHKGHEDASKYQSILAQIESEFGEKIAQSIAHANALRFIKETI
ncbi:MAG: membrane dipeptidase [Candidatus Zixiibacteriota bacterium]